MKHRKFPSPQIAEAVFRGKKMPYSFEVYPLNIEFNEVPAVYVISRRKIDKHGRAHHAIVHLGQTESLAAEVKNQRKGKYLKQYQANVVSVLLTENEKSRAAIEEDLKSSNALRWNRTLENKNLPKPPRVRKVQAEPTITQETPEVEILETASNAKTKRGEKLQTSKSKFSKEARPTAKKTLKLKLFRPKPILNPDIETPKIEVELPKTPKKVSPVKPSSTAKRTPKNAKPVISRKPLTAKAKTKKDLPKPSSAKNRKIVEKAKVLKKSPDGKTGAKKSVAGKAPTKQIKKVTVKTRPKVDLSKQKASKKPTIQKAKVAEKMKKSGITGKVQAKSAKDVRKNKAVSKKAIQPKTAGTSLKKKTSSAKPAPVVSKSKIAKSAEVSAKNKKIVKAPTKLSTKVPAKVSAKVSKTEKGAKVLPKTKAKIEKDKKVLKPKDSGAKANKTNAKRVAETKKSKPTPANSKGKNEHLKTTSRKRLAF